MHFPSEAVKLMHSTVLLMEEAQRAAAARILRAAHMSPFPYQVVGALCLAAAGTAFFDPDDFT